MAISSIPEAMRASTDWILFNSDGWLNAGQFLSGFLAVSIFAIPLMNFHLGAIVTRQLAFGLAGNVCAIGAIVGYYGWQAYKSDSIGGFM